MLAAAITFEGGVFTFLVGALVSLIVYIWKGETDERKEMSKSYKENTTALTELTVVITGLKDDINRNNNDIVDNSKGIAKNSNDIANINGRLGTNGTAA